MPQWIDDRHLDGAWLRSKIPRPEASGAGASIPAVPVRDIGTNQGRVGATPRQGGTLRLTLVPTTDNASPDEDDDDPQQLVLKQIPLERAGLSRQLGLAREALFYQHLAPLVFAKNSSSSSSSLPRIYYAHGDLETGEKCIIMESLSSPGWLDSGILFGPTATFRGNPNNWNRNLPGLLAAAYGSSRPVPRPAAVAHATFQAVARIHAAFWRDAALLLSPEYHWLRGHAWLQGHGRDAWEASQALIRGVWKDYVEKENKNAAAAAAAPSLRMLQWNPTVRAAVEQAVAGISWSAQQERLHVDGRWTLVHGDFWPGNVLWNTTTATTTTAATTTSASSTSSSSNAPEQQQQQLRLLDWEMVGLGSGPQDLGQYVLSNMDPVDRRACERHLLRAYYDELLRCGVADDNESDNNSLWDYCWREYTVGGVERWLWFLVYFLGQPRLTEWAQFFHDQIAAFMEDHRLTAADITQPRP